MAGRRPQGGGGDGEEADMALFFFLALLVCICVPWGAAVLWSLLFPGKREIAETFPASVEVDEKETKQEEAASADSKKKKKASAEDEEEDPLPESGRRVVLAVRHPQTAAMAARREAQMQHLRSRRRLFTRGFILRLIVLASLWAWLLYVMVAVRSVLATSALYQGFDPYEILKVSRGASEKEVKKAYRALAIKLHPDKLQLKDSKAKAEAEERFLLLAKAQAALTDPQAKYNYERYGNPDGPTRMELKVALPSIAQGNEGLVLVLFVLLFIIGVPLTLLCCMSDGSDVCSNGVLRPTMEDLAKAVERGDVVNSRAAYELVAKSHESSRYAKGALGAGDEAILAQLLTDLSSQGQGGGSRGSSSKAKKAAQQEASPPAATARGELLLFAHLQRRHHELSGELRAELEELLPKWRAVTAAMMLMSVKTASGDGIAAAVHFHRCLLQALDPAAVEATATAATTSLLQVPHFTAERVKQWRKGPRKAATLGSLLQLPREQLRASLQWEPPAADGGGGTGAPPDAQELADIEDFAATAPLVEVKSTHIFVEGEEDGKILEGDIATLEVRLTRQNVAEGEAVGPVHAPFYPSAAVPETWWLLLELPAALVVSDKKNNAGSKRAATGTVTLCSPATFRGRQVTADLKFPVRKRGRSQGRLRVISGDYVGLDMETSISFQVEAAPAKPVAKADEEEEEEEEADEEDDDDDE